MLIKGAQGVAAVLKKIRGTFAKSKLSPMEKMTVGALINPPRDDAMMTSLNGNIFRVTGPLLQKPVTRSFVVFFDLLLHERLSK